MSKSNKKYLKKNWRTFHSELRQLLNDWDFMGVMDSAPEDEYDGLNGQLLGMLMDNKSKEKIIKKIQHETSTHYGVDVQITSIKEFINKVMTWWNSKKEKIC